MTATAARKPLAPIIDLVRLPIARCALLPEGRPGVVTIDADIYTLAYHTADGDVVGYRMEKVGEPASSYDVPADLSSCECMGWLRWNKCRHLTALRCVKATGRVA